MVTFADKIYITLTNLFANVKLNFLHRMSCYLQHSASYICLVRQNSLNKHRIVTEVSVIVLSDPQLTDDIL